MRMNNYCISKSAIQFNLSKHFFFQKIHDPQKLFFCACLTSIEIHYDSFELFEKYQLNNVILDLISI